MLMRQKQKKRQKKKLENTVRNKNFTNKKWSFIKKFNFSYDSPQQGFLK